MSFASLEQQIKENLAAGMSPEDARYSALRALGGMTQIEQQCRDARGGSVISPETLNGVYGATKAFIIAFSHSLQRELADKGIRIQAALPGATGTDIWEIAGLPWQRLPPSIIMSTEDMVDAALAGLDHGELDARRALLQRFGHSMPAPRYGIGLARSACQGWAAFEHPARKRVWHHHQQDRWEVAADSVLPEADFLNPHSFLRTLIT
jgi:NAD(P)-dependent dehydrogenase (short-subunit alcohol dehydrogenase family)